MARFQRGPFTGWSRTGCASTRSRFASSCASRPARLSLSHQVLRTGVTGDGACSRRKTQASKERQLRSQELRTHNHQGDALRLGMNWTEEDLSKPQVLVESAWGMGHPGTFHFGPLIDEVSHGIFEAGGKPGVFTVSDICDGI